MKSMQHIPLNPHLSGHGEEWGGGTLSSKLGVGWLVCFNLVGCWKSYLKHLQSDYCETDTLLPENSTEGEEGGRAQNIQGLPKRVIGHFTGAWLEYIWHK